MVPQPFSAEQVNDLVELMKAPPAGEEDFLLDLLANYIPAGVDSRSRRLRTKRSFAVVNIVKVA